MNGKYDMISGEQRQTAPCFNMQMTERGQEMRENLLTVVEAAEILKVKKNTVYDMIKRGDLKASKLGKQLRIRQEDLDEYIQYGGRKPNEESAGNRDGRGRYPAGGYGDAPVSWKNRENAADAVFRPSPGQETKGRDSGMLIICGQDMVLDLLADRLSRHPEGCPALRSYKGSYNGLYAMYQGQVDVATAHLWHGATDSYNLPYISSMLPGTDVVVVHMLKRKEGFYVKKGNPKNIRTFEDLKREDVRIVNREPGSGARVLMDEKLRTGHILTSEVRGYHNIVNSHLEAAAAVSRGEADAALGTEKHSRQVAGIDFVFQQEESYDMVFRKEDFFRPAYQTLLSILRSKEYQDEVSALGGYDVTGMGEVIYSD